MTAEPRLKNLGIFLAEQLTLGSLLDAPQYPDTNTSLQRRVRGMGGRRRGEALKAPGRSGWW